MNTVEVDVLLELRDMLRANYRVLFRRLTRELSR